MISKKRIETAIDNFLKASREMGFRIHSPFIFHNNGTERTALAFLPEYGSHGVIVGLTSAPYFETDKDIIERAKRNQCYYSFINIENLMNYNDVFFRELLADWTVNQS